MKNKLQIVLIGIITVLAMACSDEMLLTDESGVLQDAATTLKSGVNDMGGFNWADARDNFVNGWVIPSGLTSSDSYSTVQSKANTILTAFQNAGANTIRLPINPPSVLESWWGNYKGAIDKATSMNMYVILCCWESSTSKDGKVDNLTDFWDMWDVVVSDYGSNSKVFFEPFNEPHGYTTNQLRSLYDDWLDNYPGVPDGRVVLGGTGYSENVSNIGGYYPNCLLSQHLYAWWGNHTTISAWFSELSGRIGSYGNRTILSEFGAPMTTSKDYNGAINGDAEIAFIQAMSQYCNQNDIASVYWPGLRDDDTYTMYTYNGSMSLTNSSGLAKVQYGWGSSSSGGSSSGGSGGGYYRIVNKNSGKALDVNGGSTADGANVIQWGWNGGDNQQWQLIDLGGGYNRIVNKNSGKDLDVNGGSTSNGANIIQWGWNGGNNQQWQVIDNGNGYHRIINRNSNKSLDVDGSSTSDGGNIIQWSYWGGDNQQWELIEL